MARGKWTQKVTLKVMKNHTLSCVCLVIQDETKRRGFVCWNFLSHMTQPKEVLRSYHNRQKEETWKLYLVQNGSWITLDDCPGHHATERAFIYQFNLQVFSGYEEKTFRFCLLLIRLIILPFVQLVPGNVCVAYVSAIKLKSSTQQTCERFSRCIRSMESTWKNKPFFAVLVSTIRQRAFLCFNSKPKQKRWRQRGKKEKAENKTHHPNCIQSIQLEGKQFDRTDCKDKCGLFAP